MTEQFDLFGARAERSLGIARVTISSEAWIMRGLMRIRNLSKGYEGTAEEIRIALDLGPPPSPGAVGAMTHYAKKLGLLVKTTSMRPPRGVKSHARATYVWRKT